MKLHTLRVLAAVFTIAFVAAIPIFRYWAAQMPVESGSDVVFYSVVSLFAGCSVAGGALFLLMAIRGGSLPAWFVRASRLNGQDS